MNTQALDALLASARQGIEHYLEEARRGGQIDEQSYQQARSKAFENLRKWLEDPHIDRVSPRLKEGLTAAITAGRWEQIVNAFRREVSFGTGGIRGMMAFDRESIETLHEQGIGAPILKGPNTINDIVLLRMSAGVAKYGKDQSPPFQKAVIGYDSRVRGHDFAAIVAQLFLAYGYTVYFFDEPCPYPELNFAIPWEGIKAELGIFISASHNDYRYNGYKLSCGNGSQFDPEQRDEMYKKYITKATTGDIQLCSFADAPEGRLVFLGGERKVEGFDYFGREQAIINIHREHGSHVKSFLLTDDLAARQREAANPLKIAYCAFHGAGRRAAPRLLEEVGFRGTKVITEGGLNDLNGLFPSFSSAAGRERQPDPGDPRAAEIAVAAFKRQYGSFRDIDILIGTDPDADRCGVVVKVPEAQRQLYDGKDWVLLPADTVWTLLLWYRLHREIEEHKCVRDAERKFIALSCVTSDSLALLARKHGLGVLKTWVGFPALAAAVRDVWDKKEIKPLREGRVDPAAEICDPFVCEYQDMNNGKRAINVAAMEQSNGFSILGGPPADDRSLGPGGHVRDKDGTFAALLVAEAAAWAKEHGTTLFELVDRQIYADRDIGLFVNHYEPDPMDGEYPGIQGDRKKKEILRRALGYFQFALAGDLTIADRPVTSAVIYRTGKYDAIFPPTCDFHFPDEGVRFYLQDSLNHVTVRPSGTGNSLRFYVQLHEHVTESDLVQKKKELMSLARAITDCLRQMLKAPRS